MFCGVRTRFFVVVFFLCLASATHSKSIKKSKDQNAVLNKKLIGKAKPLPPAIIAIEIVDPNENKTSKNSKRTIGAALGYGYQPPPRYEVYKYSQHDIPPYRGDYPVFSGGIKAHNYDIQKSVSYQLNQFYQPGTTLYSTINNQGQVDALSSHAPQQYQNEPHVPVIILRVLPSQLADPSAVLHPSLPQNHPLATTINSIDIQSLLSKYAQNILVNQQHEQQQQYHYEPQQYQQYQEYQQYSDYPQDDGLLTHENYPKETHTRVIFRTDKNQQGESSVKENEEVKTIQVHLPPNHSYSSVEVETPDMHYGYTNEDGNNQNYYYQQGYYYQGAQESGYQQPEPEQTTEHITPYNYHAHQKRSKKTKFSRIRNQHADNIQLDPIKA